MLKHRVLPLALCLLMLSGCATRLDRQSEFLKYKDNGTIAEIDRLLSDFQKENGLVGMSVGILKEDRVRFFNYGVTQQGGAPVSEETQYEIGTVSQMFTGHVFGEYVFRGYLTPDTPITRHFTPSSANSVRYLNLPWWGDDGSRTLQKGFVVDEIEVEATKGFPTYRDVATHRSGFEDKPDNLPEGSNPYAEYDELALRRYLSRATLENEPGTVYNPDGMDMGLLGFILKTSIDKSDFEYEAKYSIMYRIGMTKTTITMTEEQEAARAMPHDAAGQLTSVQDYDAMSGIAGMAGFKSSAYDMINYATVFMNRFPIGETDRRDLASDDKATRQKALTKLTVEQRMTGGAEVATAQQYSEEGVSVGYGFNLGQMNGEKLIWQSGGSLGYHTYFGVVPGTGTAVVILVNGPVDTAALGEEILAILQ